MTPSPARKIASICSRRSPGRAKNSSRRHRRGDSHGGRRAESGQGRLDLLSVEKPGTVARIVIEGDASEEFLRQTEIEMQWDESLAARRVGARGHVFRRRLAGGGRSLAADERSKSSRTTACG